MIEQPANSITLNNFIKEHGFKLGAELGVRRGEFSAFLLQDNPELFMNMIDLWPTEAHPTIMSLPGETYGQNESNYQTTLQNVAPFKGRYQIFRLELNQASELFDDKSLDFIFIDSTHTVEGLQADMAHWVPKVKDEGLISGHDHHHSFQGGRFQAYIDTLFHNMIVDEYTCWFGWKKDLK